MENFTDLEKGIFSLYFKIYEEHGFPSVENISFNKRIEDDCGRYTYVDHDGRMSFEKGTMNAGDHCCIEIDDISDGLYFEVAVAEYKVNFLHIFSNGGSPWSGSEAGWKIL